MFSRSRNAPTWDRADPRRSSATAEAGLSIVAAGVVIGGDLVTSGDIHLDGEIDGNLDVREAVIGETGRVTGDIRADAVTVRGAVTGRIAARSVRIERTARVTGDIAYASIGIESGAVVVGQFILAAEAAPPAPPQLTVVAAAD